MKRWKPTVSVCVTFRDLFIICNVPSSYDCKFISSSDKIKLFDILVPSRSEIRRCRRSCRCGWWHHGNMRTFITAVSSQHAEDITKTSTSFPRWIFMWRKQLGACTSPCVLSQDLSLPLFDAQNGPVSFQSQPHLLAPTQKQLRRLFLVPSAWDGLCSGFVTSQESVSKAATRDYSISHFSTPK